MLIVCCIYVQDIQMTNNCFNLTPLAMDDFPQINMGEPTMWKVTEHQDNMGCDKFKEYMKGSVMFEDIFDLCSTQASSITLPLEDWYIISHLTINESDQHL